LNMEHMLPMISKQYFKFFGQALLGISEKLYFALCPHSLQPQFSIQVLKGL